MKVEKTDWLRILEVMKFYSRKDGYVDFIGDKLTFFDSDPQINGVGACYVTIENVKKYIK